MQVKAEIPRSTPAQSSAAARGKRFLFGRVWSEARTSFYILGVPLICKEKAPERDVLKFIGIPVIKTYYNKFDKKTRFLGIPVSTRPNYRYLEQRIAGSISCLRALPNEPVKPCSNPSSPITLSQAREILSKLPSYQLMCDTRDGRLLQKDELMIVTQQVEKLLAPEGKIDG